MPISNTATCPICRIEGRTPKMGYEYDASLDLPGTIHTYDVIISKKEFLCKTCNLKFSSYDLWGSAISQAKANLENIPENEYSTYFRDLILNYDPENTIERMSIKLGAVLLIEDLEILDELRNHNKIDELPKKEKIRENIEFKINRLHDRESRRS